MKNRVNRITARLALAFTGLAVAGSAAAVDVTAAVSTIDGGMSSVQAIGVAALGVLAAAAVFKYVRRAL